MFSIWFLPPRFTINSIFSLRLQRRPFFQIGPQKPLVSLHLMQAIIYFIMTSKSIDINECKERLDDCAAEARCSNRYGSFECICLPGYYGDGRFCNGTYNKLKSLRPLPLTFWMNCSLNVLVNFDITSMKLLKTDLRYSCDWKCW